MRQENTLQQTVVNSLREKGYHVVIGGLAPGYPDLTAIKKGRAFWIENKDASEYDLTKRAKDLFEKFQIPTYLEFINMDYAPLYIIFKRPEVCWVFRIKDKHDVISLNACTLGEIFSNSHCADDPQDAVKFIIREDTREWSEKFLKMSPKFFSPDTRIL